MTGKIITNNKMWIRQEMETFSDRVELLLQERGATKVWLAQELGISRQALNQVLRHNIKPKFVSEIALAFNVNPKWLETGKGKRLLTDTSPVPNKSFFIKVYALDDLRKANDLKRIKPIDKVIADSEEESLSFLGIKLQNYPSMLNGFPDQCILLFDKNQKPSNGDFVLARKDQDFLFRQYLAEGNTVVLKPVNDNFETITVKRNKAIIYGVLKETRVRF